MGIRKKCQKRVLSELVSWMFFYKHDENNEEHDKVQWNGSDNGNYFKDLINYNNYFGYYFIVNSIEEKNF